MVSSINLIGSCPIGFALGGSRKLCLVEAAMMYWATVYALITVFIFAAMGILYLGIATTLWLVPVFQRVRAWRLQ
jgi:membrane protein YdbS with pleckstrin-like domain